MQPDARRCRRVAHTISARPLTARACSAHHDFVAVVPPAHLRWQTTTIRFAEDKHRGSGPTRRPAKFPRLGARDTCACAAAAAEKLRLPVPYLRRSNEVPPQEGRLLP